MTRKTTLLLAATIGLVLTTPGSAQARRGDDQGGLRNDVREGKVKSPREIEAGVVPRMRGMQYLGQEYDSVAQAYRLKFINRDRVIFVDVDGKTGAILRQR